MAVSLTHRDEHRQGPIERIVVRVEDPVLEAVLLHDQRQGLRLVPVQLAREPLPRRPRRLDRQAGDREGVQGGHQHQRPGQPVLRLLAGESCYEPGEEHAGDRRRRDRGLQEEPQTVLEQPRQGSHRPQQEEQAFLSPPQHPRQPEHARRREGVGEQGHRPGHVTALAVVPFEVPQEMQDVGRTQENRDRTGENQSLPAARGQAGQENAEPDHGSAPEVHVRRQGPEQDGPDVTLLEEEVDCPRRQDEDPARRHADEERRGRHDAAGKQRHGEQRGPVAAEPAGEVRGREHRREPLHHGEDGERVDVGPAVAPHETTQKPDGVVKGRPLQIRSSGGCPVQVVPPVHAILRVLPGQRNVVPEIVVGEIVPEHQQEQDQVQRDHQHEGAPCALRLAFAVGYQTDAHAASDWGDQRCP